MKAPGPLWLWPLLMLAAVSASRAAEPAGRAVLDIAATREFPRNSEGSFASLRTGSILFAYSQFYASTGDSSPCRIAEIASDDQGRTWGAIRTLVETGAHLGVMSPSFVRLADGRLALFYDAKDSPLDCHPLMRVSADEGASWSPPRSVIAAPGYFVLNNDRVIESRRGRLIVPVAFQRQLTTDPRAREPVDLHGLALWYTSDDAGGRWTQSSTWWALPVASRNGLQEPGVVELADGTLFSWARTDQGCQYGFLSHDGGSSWSAPEPTALASPCAPCSIRRLPGSADLLAVYNDHSGRFPFARGADDYMGRSPLVAAISKDGGRTWPWRREIEDDLGWDYCYTAIHVIPGAVLIAYAAADAAHLHPELLRLRRIDLSWFADGGRSGHP